MDKETERTPINTTTALALFDFDGTITTKDTFLEVIKYQRGKLPFLIGFIWLSPFLILFKLKLLPNWLAKEKVITYFFKGMGHEVFQQGCDRFAEQVLPALIRPKALEKIKEHLKLGHKVVVVSASAENWISKWCHTNKVELIGTKLEVKDGKLTGKILGKNCHGPEKVNRVKAVLKLDGFQEVYAYGDSSGDKEMLALVEREKAFYRPFRN